LKKLKCFFNFIVIIRLNGNPSFHRFSKHSSDLLFSILVSKMKQHALRIIAQSPALLSKYLNDTKRHFDKLDAVAAKATPYQHMRRKHTTPILALMKEIGDERKMVIRMVQVQHEQINKYRKSIRDGRKTVKRGAPASLESVTMETMVQMTLRVIQDMKDGLPNLIEPLVARIYKRLSKLQKHMQLFTQYTETEFCTRYINYVPSDCQCDCPPCRQCQCHECHEGNCSRDVVWDGPEPGH
jgi:hypothetical protein